MEKAKTPRRTKNIPKFKWSYPFHAIPNEIVVPSPFGIYSPKEKLDYHKEPLILRYGEKLEMRISGRQLNIKDQDVFIALTELAAEYKSLDFTTSVNELCRKLKRPYAETSKESIRKSLRRLREALVETVSFDDDGKEENAEWIIGGMISEAARNRNDQIHVKLDSSFNRLFGKRFLTSFDSQYRLSLKGSVAKQLYLFYQRHVSARKKQTRQTHKIGLKKLCGLIGLGIDKNLPLYSKRYQIKKGCEELIRQGYLKSYDWKPNDILYVVFDKQWLEGRKQQVEQKKKTGPKKIESKPPTTQKGQKSSFLKYIEKEVSIEFKNNIELANSNIKKIQAVVKALNDDTIFKKFVGWMKKQHSDGEGWLKIIHYSTLDPGNDVFASFMAQVDLTMPMAQKIDRHFKLLTESPEEKRQREVRELKEREEQEREAQEYKEREDWAYSCVKDNLRDLKEQDIEKLNIHDIMNEHKNKHGESWRIVFEKLVKDVEKKYQSDEAAKHMRRASYIMLFRMMRDL
jgi:hypothetical protein